MSRKVDERTGLHKKRRSRRRKEEKEKRETKEEVLLSVQPWVVTTPSRLKKVFSSLVVSVSCEFVLSFSFVRVLLSF